VARAAVQQGMIDRFTYTPGDGHRYVWQAGRSVVTVYAIRTMDGVMRFFPTGDTIDVSDIPEPATAGAMSARVDAWRATRQGGAS
jgi:hypothetical protein